MPRGIEDGPWLRTCPVPREARVWRCPDRSRATDMTAAHASPLHPRIDRYVPCKLRSAERARGAGEIPTSDQSLRRCMRLRWPSSKRDSAHQTQLSRIHTHFNFTREQMHASANPRELAPISNGSTIVCATLTLSLQLTLKDLFLLRMAQPRNARSVIPGCS